MLIYKAGLPGSIVIGHLRVPVFGLFATAGLVAGLLLSERTAERAGVDRDKLWDAGVAGIILAFVASRVLLVAENFPVFKALPLLVLTLPSLTYGGIFLTMLLLLVYLRWKRVPVLAATDAWAPGACLLAAFLELGHFFEGTGAGMPTSLPWGVVTPGDSVMGRVQPVQLYGAVVALGLAVVSYRGLARSWYRGQITAWVLGLGGVAAFLLDMMRQPEDSQTSLPLEASQLSALCAIVGAVAIIAAVSKSRPPITPEEAAEILEKMALGTGGPYDHEIFEYYSGTDPILLELQPRVPDLFPPADGMTAEDVDALLLNYAKRLRGKL